MIRARRKRARPSRGRHPSILRENFLWDALYAHDAHNAERRVALEELNAWRNAIAHQDFDPAKLGIHGLRLARVNTWRQRCSKLALADSPVRELARADGKQGRAEAPRGGSHRGFGPRAVLRTEL